MAKTPAWTRKEGKSPSGGLNQKGRDSYNKANPGSNLKAPQPEGGPRKKSFLVGAPFAPTLRIFSPEPAAMRALLA